MLNVPTGLVEFNCEIIEELGMDRGFSLPAEVIKSL